ncbi:hypothetical protein BO94DRAFT_150291 [Aspergillus sclerotioniger CBS 115572]|uniref:RmlC-like cupin n=1 Tax=Aspergillus sclerotioniger CBS 115572 TaxID=1450535 RepID=A0A317W688_9EURO|nr:hypothetical protein BO94DRAFT_150291 [Aspergillus sclerotioniger CBS 115572]PWY80822.1 hypothetical protein BO94DRAFT_150291 [Aspergillus sclerotioniger CBS 115572]
MPEILHASNTPYIPLSLTHRGPGLSFKHLFLGTEQTSENYLFSLAHQSTFYSPRHKHNFDQFRFAYRNSVSISPDILLQEGELCYHPEGVEYGPQDDPEGGREVLVLQFGGASGQGYLSFGEIERAQGILKRRGVFVGGRFFEGDSVEGLEGEGKGKGKDGYEALWEEMMGRELVYPVPRYGGPVVVKPEGFAWVGVAEGEGTAAWRKCLGVFSERETRVEMVKLDEGGEVVVEGRDAIQLFFVLKGEGRVDGEEVRQESAVRLQPGDGAEFASEKGMEFLRFVLPMLR